MNGCLLDRKGVALVMALLVIVFSAGLLAAVTYYSLSGSEMSGLQKKYQSSKEASLGGIEILTKEIIPKAVVGATLSTIGASFANTGILPTGNVTLSVSNSCFSDKMSKVKTAWGCTPDTDPMNAAVQPDITLRLRSNSGDSKDFRVDLKIVDTRPGNSDISGATPSGVSGVRGLDAKGVVAQPGSGGGGGGSSGPVEHIPFLYTIAAEGRSVSGLVGERADLEVLYAY